MIRCRTIFSPLKSSFRNCSVGTTTINDVPTNVNIHEHKLSRPQKIKNEIKGSLIPETLKEMLADEQFQLAQKALKAKGQKSLTKEERLQRQRALDLLGVPPFHIFLEKYEKDVSRRSTQTLQLNIGLYCNQACSHCHVESSPKRTEVMSKDVADRCLYLLQNSSNVVNVDITGGAPELTPQFRHIVKGATSMGKHVIDRCNLTALLEPGQDDTAKFLADHKVHVIASLPCYSPKNVNLQRGSGVFQRSIAALNMLNELGYGMKGSDLVLDLVYNPLGAFLPPDEAQLEMKYKEELKEAFDIEFNSLYTMTNMPIKRFADFLRRRNELQGYLELLIRNFNQNTVEDLMCRNLISVNWDGGIFDCDFNQQLDIPLKGGPRTVFDIEKCDDLLDIPVSTDNHCYGCTAGKGSS